MFQFTTKHKIPFQIDDSDFEAVSHYFWHTNSKGYILTKIKTFDGNNSLRPLFLHAFLLGSTPKGFECDHRNQDKSDYRRENLRWVTHPINQRNTGIRSSNTSGFKGVSKCKGKWKAYITSDGIGIHLGFFETVEGAAKARKDAEELYWGSDR